MPYWLTHNILGLRIEALRCRRRLARARSRRQDTVDLEEEFRQPRRTLLREIGREKRRRWKNLCDELDRNPFGQAYKIVVSQLKLSNPRTTMTQQEKRALARELFVEDCSGLPESTKVGQLIPLTGEEVTAAANRIKLGRAPGIDGLTPEVIKASIGKELVYYKEFFYAYLRSNCFLREWKMSKLVLIEKPRKLGVDTVKYRPLCLINGLAKVYENLINNKLLAEIEERGGLQSNQFGFRKEDRQFMRYGK